MRKHNANNERTKHKYLAFLRDAKRYSEPTVDTVAKAISRFEAYTGFRDFKLFHIEQARAFKKYLTEQRGVRSKEALSKATLHSTLSSLKNFFQWLSMQPGYKSRIQYPDAEYFNLPTKDIRIATAHREQKVPTIGQIRHVIQSMPAATEIDRRNQALIAFTLLTGARDSAIASLKLKHVDLIEGYVDQDARQVHTKFSKTFRIYFFPVGEEVREIVANWISFLREEKHWGNDDPLFPKTKMVQGSDLQFRSDGLDRQHWRTTSPIRDIFREAFERAGQPYFNPHSFRNTLVAFAEKLCRTTEEFKACSQNLGHEKIMTTLINYGAVTCQRQGEILRNLGALRQASPPDAKEIVEMLKRLQDYGVNVQIK